jgi:hypothetical protein
MNATRKQFNVGSSKRYLSLQMFPCGHTMLNIGISVRINQAFGSHGAVNITTEILFSVTYDLRTKEQISIISSKFVLRHEEKCMEKITDQLHYKFFVLLTVHLDVILGNDQLDALFLNVFVLCLYMFRATSAHHQEGQIVLIHHLV